MAFKMTGYPFHQNNPKLTEALRKMEKDLEKALLVGDSELARKIRLDIKSMRQEIGLEKN